MDEKEDGKDPSYGIDPAAFDWSALDRTLTGCSPGDYLAINAALENACQDEAISECDKFVYRTFYNLCFLHFEPSSRNKPFTPAIRLSDRRSFAIEDLEPQALDFLDAAGPMIARPDLRGRVYDILWLRRRDLGIRTALGAIEAYSQLSLVGIEESLTHRIVDCWDRALSLGRLIRGAAEPVIQPLVTSISDALDESLAAKRTVARELSSLSLRYGLDTDKQQERSTAFQAMADYFREEGGYFAERVFLTAASDWEAAIHRGRNYWDIIARIAASHELEADHEEQSSDPSYIRIASYLEQAIQGQRRIPRQFRSPEHNERAIALRQRHAAAGERALEELSVYESEPMDLTKIAAEAKTKVRGKSALEALMALISLVPIPQCEDLLEAERQHLSKGSISAIFGRVTLGDDGRVIAKVPSSTTESDEDLARIRATENYVRIMEVLVTGAIAPALDAFNEEHCIRERELMPLVSESAAVPPGRELFFAKGLAAGFDWDFVSSSHLLTPQLEAFLRYQIKGRGGDTTIMSADGIQSEASLGTLLDMDLTQDILGPNMSFLFEALLVNSHGVNFRNRQAHGLIAVSTAGGPHSVFLWWLCLYLVLLPFWSVSKSPEDPTATHPTM